MSFNLLRTDDIRLFLDTLQPNTKTPGADGGPSCRTMLEGTLAGKIYLPLLDQVYARISGTPVVVVPAGTHAPLATELDEVDHDHDGFLGALRLCCQMIVTCPSSPQDVRDSAQRILDAISPVSALASYPDQAVKEPYFKGLATSLQADLDKIIIAWEGPGRTAKHWMESLGVAAGQMAQLLHQRAHILGGAANSVGANKLRPEAISYLTNLRNALEAERKSHPTLPENVDTLIFGYLDALVKLRVEQSLKTATADVSVKG